MIPNDRAFHGKESVEVDGRTYYRTFKIDKQGIFRCNIHLVAVNSEYKQAIAFGLSTLPAFKGKISLNGQRWEPDKGKRTAYVIPVSMDENRNQVIMDVDIEAGYIPLANASDFLDDYSELIAKVSAQTGRTRDQFRGCSFTSGFTAANVYGNAFWIQNISEGILRFHCNDHRMDDDFDDLIFDLEIIENEI